MAPVLEEAQHQLVSTALWSDMFSQALQKLTTATTIPLRTSSVKTYTINKYIHYSLTVLT